MRTIDFNPLKLLAVAALMLGACADDIAADPADDPIETLQSAAVVSSWTSPECSEAGLTSLSYECDGPWLYTVDEVVEEKHVDCPNTTCVKWGPTESWDYGVELVPGPFQEQTTREQNCTETCDYADIDDCFTHCAPVFNKLTWCDQKVAAREQQLEDSVPTPPGPLDESTIVVVRKGMPSSTDGPVTLDNKNDQQISKWSRTITCTMEVNQKPKPKKDTTPPCIKWADSVCWHDVGDVAKVSEPGVWLGTLPPRHTMSPVYPDSDAEHSPSVCLTCEHDADPKQQFLCLEGRRNVVQTFPFGASSVTAAQLTDSLTARLKLLFLRKAHLLEPEQLDEIRSLYNEVGAVPACGIADTLPPVCVATLQPSGHLGRLRACRALTHVDASTEAAVHQISTCIAVVHQLANLPSTTTATCGDSLRDESAAMLEDLLARRYETFTGGEALVDGLRSALQDMDAWYTAIAGLPGADADWVFARESTLLARFWRAAHDTAYALPAELSPDSAVLLVQNATDFGLGVDHAVLLAAFGDDPPLDEPPLLSIVSSALRGTWDRTESLLGVHDVACRYKKCKAGAGMAQSTPTSQMTHILARVHDKAGMESAVQGLVFVSSSAPLRKAMEGLYAHHDVLATAYRAAAGSSTAELAQLLETGSIPREAEQLATMIARAGDLHDNYRRTGYFDGGDANVFSAGVQDRVAILADLDWNIQLVNTALSTFQSARVELVTQLLGQLHNQNEQAAAEQRLEELLLLAAQSIEDQVGLMEREAQQGQAFGNFMEGFEAVIDSGVIDGNLQVAVDHVGEFALSGNDAKWQPGLNALDSIAALKVPLDAGHMLHVSIDPDDTWSPSCALASASLPGPDGGMADVNLSNPQTGPEGYWAQWTGEEYSASSSAFSIDLSATVANSIKACGEIGIGLPKLGSSVEQCITTTISAGTSQDWTWSSGEQGRYGASFSAGIRLANTPYPLAPAGSLLAVVSRRQTGEVLDVQVVGRQQAILASEAADVYLVVNDLGTCGDVSQPSALHGSLTRSRALEGLARDVADSMAGTLAHIRAVDLPLVLAAGELLPSEASAIRSAAWSKAEQAAGTSSDLWPTALKSYFTMWLDATVASLERQASWRAHDRRLAQIGLEMRGVERELRAAEGRSQLLELLPRWTLRKLAATELDEPLQGLLYSLTMRAAPVLELRYPDDLALMRSEVDGALNDLLALQYTANVDDIMDELTDFATEVRSTISSAQGGISGIDTKEVVLGILQEGKTFETAYQRAALNEESMFWGAVRADGWAQITITPEMLYSPETTLARLDCYDAAPTIRRMSVYAVTSGSTVLDYGHRLEAEVSKDIVFPTTEGLLSFVTEGISHPSVPVLEGGLAHMIQGFRSHVVSRPGEGLSPFATWRFRFTGYESTEPLKSVVGFFIVFELETQRGSEPVIVPNTCPG